ncbi:MAG: OmpA family protein [Flavobacteriales bacterium]|nr:OmpA family protein [Flavobacteriales bacterium]MCB9447639.1 OmpA family protein [Flavobacteriales bacterium]
MKHTSLRSFRYIATVLCLPFMALAQDEDPKALFDKAESYIEYLDFQQALPYYLRLIKTDPENANFNYKVGMCYLHSPSDQGKAIPYFKKAILHTTPKYHVNSFKETNAPDDAFYYVAQAFHLGNQIDSALYYYDKFKPLIEEKVPHLLPEVARQVKMCQNAKQLMANPVKIDITNLGSTINTSFPEYGPVLSVGEDVLIFTSCREGSTGGYLTDDGYFYEDIYISNKENGKWTQPVSIGTNINTSGNEATISLSADGQELFIYKDDNGDGNIYVSKLNGDQWSAPEKLGPTVNTSYLETHASMTPDGNRLFFASDRPGGFGGLDIYMVQKLPTGEWSMAQNLGPKVNTQYDEDGPFIHPDGVTLYFSSESESSMGGFDIFSSSWDEVTQSWGKPKNIGYPINTTADDLFFVMTADGKRAYYSSATEEGYGDRDIYMIQFASHEETGLTVMKGTVQIGESGRIPEDAKITVRDLESKEVLGEYTPNKKSGKYLLILPPGKNYTVSFEAQGYMTHSENLFVPPKSTYKELNKPIKLNNLVVRDKLELRNIYFEYNSAKLTKDSEKELDKLYDFLTTNTKLVISVQGHTDNKGNEKYNLELSQKRTESVKKYLVKKGIFAARIRAKGFGSSQPIAKNTNADGSDNEKGRALNRRIEIIIIGGENEFDVVKKDEVPEELKINPE